MNLIHIPLCLMQEASLLNITLMIMNGNHEKALEIVEEMRKRAEQVGALATAIQTSMVGEVRALINLGIYKTVPEDLARLYEGRMQDCIVHSYLGRKEDARKTLDRFVVNRPNMGTNKDFIPYFADVAFLEASVLAGHAKAAEMLLRRLSGTGLYTSGFRWPTCISRHLGAAAVMLERHEEAREHYKESIRICTEMRFRPELALSRLQLAELLLDHYPDEKTDALEHLAFSIEEFREMKMQPSLERALRRKDILKA